ncbi:MAG: argininosuccinate lyase [Patescibacteria group bacterium]
MKDKLWQTKTSGLLHPLVETYTVGNDYQLDQQLLGYDITATKAHVVMLESIGILTTSELNKLLKALDTLHQEWLSGVFEVTSDHEDGHTAIELYLTHKLGRIGKKVHTGRSRNDQALVMMRLYLKDSLQHVSVLVEELVGAYNIAADKAGKTPMPGYTHTQKAMPTTVATWLSSFQAGFSDVEALIKATSDLIDQNPLGSAAGFGVSLAIDRELTTKNLQFQKTQDNPMYCGLSRGLFELMSVQVLNPLMVLAGKFAQDMLMFTSQEFNFFRLPDNLTTGSSIMPHKRNYDLFEIMRGQAHAFSGYSHQLQAIAGGTGSGYNRDLQLTKSVTLTAFDTAKVTLETLALAVSCLKLNKANLKASMTSELYTVAAINKLVGAGMPFRDAYLKVKLLQ